MSVTQQEINTGAVANDGTGESLRDAFNAVNNNFANVWAAGPVGTNVVIRNNEVTTNINNLDLKIAGNGVGNVVVASTLQPTISGVYDLGKTTQAWGEVHAQYYYGNGAFLTGVVADAAFTSLDANGTVLSANTTTSLAFDTGNNVVITGNAATNAVAFAVSDNPVFANVTANNVVGNTVAADTFTSAEIDANLVLSPNGTGLVTSTANVVAPYFIGNIVGNISGNMSAPGGNTEVLFNDNGAVGAVAGFTFDKNNAVLTVTGEISATGNIQGDTFVGNGVGLTSTVVDRGSDINDWNAITEMGVYTVNRTSWAGTSGTPLDSQVYTGLLEVKNSTNSTLQQSFYPGQVDLNNITMQWARNYWLGSWTPWVVMVNGSQQINGGVF